MGSAFAVQGFPIQVAKECRTVHIYPGLGEDHSIAGGGHLADSRTFTTMYLDDAKELSVEIYKAGDALHFRRYSKQQDSSRE